MSVGQIKIYLLTNDYIAELGVVSSEAATRILKIGNQIFIYIRKSDLLFFAIVEIVYVDGCIV